MHTAAAAASTEPSQREAKVRESLQRAKDAVAMDVKDGTSWSESCCVASDKELVLCNSLVCSCVQKCSSSSHESCKPY